MKIRALVIEDNPDDVELLRETLGDSTNLELNFAGRLNEGLARLSADHYDAVLLDLSLPDSSGLATLRRVQQHPANPPTLVLTHLSDDAAAVQAVHEGAQDYLVKKELDGRLLERSIRYAIQRHQMLRQLEQQTQTLRDSEASLRHIVTANADGMAVIDRDGTVRFVNPGAERLFARRAAELIGRNFGRPVAGQERAELSVLQADGDTLVAEMGVTEITWEGEHAYLASLRDITSRKQNETALRLTNERLVDSMGRLERHAAEISRLSELGELLQSCQTKEEAHRVAGQVLGQLFADESGALCVLEAEKNVVEAVAVWGPEPPKESVFSTEDCWALRRGHLHAAEAGRAAMRCAHTAKDGDRVSSLCLPMMAQGEMLGLLHVKRSKAADSTDGKKEEHWKSDREHLALAVGEQLSLALANLRLRESLRHQSIRDALTGLYNRRFMEEWLERALRRAKREMKPLGILLVDVDHFKAINDKYGHEAGDAVLRQFAELLPQRVRAGDVVCRYGGEEYVLLLQDGDESVARMRGEQLLADARQMQVSYRGKPLGRITVSVGVAAYPKHGETAGDLLRSADAAMYQAKEKGRDRLVAADALRVMTAEEKVSG